MGQFGQPIKRAYKVYYRDKDYPDTLLREGL